MQMTKASSQKALKVLTISLLLIVCGYSLSYNILSNTMDPLVGEFQLTGASQGLMTSMMNLGSMLPLIIMPLLQGKFPKQIMILLACVLQVLMLLLTGLSTSFATLLTACVLLGAGNNFTDSCVNSYMVDLHPGDSAKCLGLLHGFYGIGGLLTPILASAIMAASGWRASYFAAAAIFASLIAFFIFAGMRGAKGAKVQTVQESPFTKEMFISYLKTPRNLFLLGAALFYAAAQCGLVSWVVRYTSVVFNDPQIGSYCLSAYWICTTISRLVVPRLPFKTGTLLVFGSLGACVFHLIGVLSGNAVGLVIGSALIGLTSGHCIPVMLGEAAVGNEDRTSLTTSGMFLMMGLARMVMPLIMGAASTGSMTIAMLLPALTALLCMFSCAFAVKAKVR